LSYNDFIEDVKGNDFFIIGGGNSLDTSKLSQLPRDNVICLNSSMKYFNNFFGLFWLDISWYTNRKDKIFQKNAKYKVFMTTVRPRPHDDRYIWIKRTDNLCRYSKDKDPNNVSVIGNNIGCLTLHLLDKLKANNIYLLGFDCKHVNGKSHSHDDYDNTTQLSSYRTSLIPCFEELSKNIKNIKIYNTYHDSAIKHCFPYKPLSRCLEKFNNSRPIST